MSEVEMLLQWFEAQGNGIALIHDDHCRWAVVWDGLQPMTHMKDDGTEVMITDEAIPGTWSYFVKDTDWKSSILEALRDAKARDETH